MKQGLNYLARIVRAQKHNVVSKVGPIQDVALGEDMVLREGYEDSLAPQREFLAILGRLVAGRGHDISRLPFRSIR